jgi:glycosyltransferase involved in cell wall biosynthesis
MVDRVREGGFFSGKIQTYILRPPRICGRAKRGKRIREETAIFMNKRLRVNFILHAAGKTGGVLVVLEYARLLRRMGHDARVYYPVAPYAVYFNTVPFWKRPASYLAAVWRTLRNARRVARASGDAGLRMVPFIKGWFIPNADFVAATAWPTAYSVAALPPSKGRKYYFVQHYETWNGEVDRVDASYRLPLELLTIAPWLTELMRSGFGRPVAAELHNGIDLAHFRPPVVKPVLPLTILMLHHVLPVKGIPDGLDVLRRIHERHPGARIRTFGMFPFPDADAFIEHHRDPSRELLLQLYQEAHIFLSPSLSEGWHLPPMEAMACGCAVVATRVGCIPVLESGGNLLGAAPGDRDALFGLMDALVRDPELLRETARKGRETMLEYGWEKKGRELEAFLLSAADV